MILTNRKIYSYVRCVKLVLHTLLLMFLFACQTDLETEVNQQPQKFIHLELATGEAGLASVTGEVAYEQRIDNVIALVFNQNNEFVYKAISSEPKYDNYKKKYDIKVSLFESENKEKYSVSLLVNPTKSTYTNFKVYEGKQKEYVLKKLLYDSESDTDGKNYPWQKLENGIPMYGETDYKEITSTTTFNTPVKLLRAVAKVDIFLNSEENNNEGSAVNYILSEVHLFNSITMGRIAPEMLHGAEQKNWERFIPSTPSMPSFDNNHKYNPSVLYKYGKVQSIVLNPIMLAENKGGIRGSSEEVTTFIIGLTPKDKLSNPKRYYRVDVVDATDDAHTAAILRNQYYKLLVRNVLGEGSDTPEEALDSKDRCDATLSIVPWKVQKRDASLYGKEYFEIDEREVFFAGRGTQKIGFSTNLDYISLNWQASRGKDLLAIENDTYKISFTKFPNSTRGEIEITALKETVPSIDDVENLFHVFAGNMIIPMKIVQRTDEISVGSQLETICVPYGFYVQRQQANPEQNYLELKIPTSSIITIANGAKGSEQKKLDIELGDKISVTTNKASGFDFILTNEEVQFENLTSMMVGDQMERYVSVKVPMRRGSRIDLGAKSAQFTVNFVVSKRSGDFKGQHGAKVEIDILENKPDYYVAPKVLIVGDSYSFNPDIVYSYWESRYYDVNFAKLLLNEDIFGLKSHSIVRMESFVHRDGGRKVVRNLRHVDSFRSLGNPSELENYNIIFYLNSSVENEIANSNNIYAKTLVNLVTSNKVVFIQTPSYEMQHRDGEYNDKLAAAMLGMGELIIRQSSPTTQIALDISISGEMGETLAWKYSNGRSNSRPSTPVFMPSRDKKTLFRFANIFANFRDISYLKERTNDRTYAKYMEVIGGGTFAKEGIFSTARPVIIKGKKHSYLWMGSTSIFADSAVNVSSDLYPVSQWSDTFKGWLDIPLVPTFTYNSSYIVNVMKWAMEELNKMESNKR